MSCFVYIDDILKTPGIANAATLVFAGEYRDKADDTLINIQVGNRTGRATAESLRLALDMGDKSIVLADPGYVMHSINKQDEHSTRKVIAWTVNKNRWGEGYSASPVPDRISDSPFGFGSPYVAVERPDGTFYTAHDDFPNIEAWSRHASKELVSWHKRAAKQK
jgi:hypothetical protein